MRPSIFPILFPVAVLVSAVAVAAEDPAPDASGGSTATAPATKATTSGKLTDAQILGVLTAANTGEINAANLATSKSTNDQVKAFAAEMTKDHTAMNDEGSTLATRLQITPGDSPTGQKLKASSDKEMTHLSSLSGPAFDKAYAHAAVKDHQAVLRLFDKTLIPSASNADVKDLLKTARPKIAEHLKHAMQLQAALRKTKSPVGANP